MRTSVIVAAMVASGAVAPAAAHAAASCLDQYYVCLNDTWDTKGLERYLADLECGARYYSCMRDATK
jgi:predicted transcriptional regulator